MKIDPEMLEWATPRQARYIELINKHGSIRAAARSEGVDESTVREAIHRLNKKARKKSLPHIGTPGFVPREHSVQLDESGNMQKEWLKEKPAPEFAVGGEDAGEARDGGGAYVKKGVSTLFDAEGNQVAQWVKTSLDKDKYAVMIRAAAAALSEDIPRIDPVPAPRGTDDDLCNQYTLTDSHVGMLAWKRETGADWDLGIAEDVLFNCFREMMLAAPMARVGIVCQLGDWLHFDSLTSVTPTSGHVLDADSRFPKVVKIAVRILRRVVDLALTRHDRVHVIDAEGNHDPASSVWLRVLFEALYENEPRVTVETSPLPYYVYQHGETMLGFHHGHMSKKERLPLLFAAKFPTIWGSTTKRYIHTGHYHHVDEKEHPGVKVIQHPTLAAPDAYAARGGWLSEREATALTYHKKFGLVARNTVTPEMVGAA